MAFCLFLNVSLWLADRLLTCCITPAHHFLQQGSDLTVVTATYTYIKASTSRAFLSDMFFDVVYEWKALIILTLYLRA